MRKIAVITVQLVVFFVCSGSAQNNFEAMWQKGNEFYNQKFFDSAAWCFEQIAAQKPKKAEVYYNLGNTYYRLNKIGPAVLNYERTLKLDPEYKQASDNLLLTQSRISNHIAAANEIFFLKWWNNITRQDKSATWAVTALIIFLIMIAILLLRQLNKSLGERIPVQTLFVLGFFWIWFLIIGIVASNKSVQNTGAVVMQNETPLMNNTLIGKPITIIPEGTTVAIINDTGNWVEVRLPDGRTGWIQQSLLSKI